MKKRSQASVEYMIVIAIGLSIILIGSYILRGYVFETSGRIVESRVSEIANELLIKARKIYYYGPPSKTIAVIEMPQINNMFVMAHINTDSNKNEYYLGFTILSQSGATDLIFKSDVPLKAKDKDNVNTCNPKPSICTNDFQFCECFEQKVFSKGRKDIQLISEKNCKYDSTNTFDYCTIIKLA